MDTTLGSLEASYLLWDNVWRKDSSTFTELNILDVVQLSPAGGVIGWLFTSSNGTVKSKLAANWRIEAILNRCGYLENDTIAHHYNPNVKRWMCVADPDAMQDTLSSKSSSRGAIILHPQLTKSSTFMEVLCTKTSTKEGRVEIPQYTNSWLCDLSNRGGKAKSDGLPTQSITCKDKESNQLSREYVATIVKFLESNLRIKISSINVIVMFETTASRTTTKAATNTGSNLKNSNSNATLTTANILNTEARVVRLHHIAGMTYRSAQPASFGFSSDNTVNSTIAESLGQSMASKSACRVDCCHGDFCEYAAADEAAEGSGLGGNSFDLDDYGEGEFDIKHESLKAVNRHRALKKGDPFQRMAEEEGIDGDEHGAEKMDLYPGQTDHMIAQKKEQKKIVEMNDFVASVGSMKNVNFSSGESLRSKQASLLTNKTKKISEQVKRTEKKLKVMAKSVALARQEMAEIEHRDIHNLNSGANSPNSKSHRSSSHSLKTNDPPSPSHGSSGGHSKVWPAALTKWWLSVGRNLPKNSLSVMVPSSSAHAISKVVLGLQTEKAELASHGTSLAGGGHPVEKVDDGPVEQANSLYFSWYYNPVRVCERCHKVYTELDRQRKMRFKHLMRQQRARTDKSEDETQKWREIEAKIFKQRQFVSRLAKQDAPHQAPQQSSQNNLYQQQFAQYSSQFEGLPGSNSMAFDSVVEPSGGVAFGRAYKLNSLHSNQQGSSSQQGPSLVPSKALPPVPWGLNKEGRSEAIANSNSILTRRILQKAPDQVSSHRAQARAHRDSGDSETDAVLAQWRQLTRDREEDYVQPKPRKPLKPVKKVGAAFNPDRLLHPWQREMNAMKNKIRNGEEPNAPDRKYPESQMDEYDLYGDSIDGGYEYDPQDPSNAANYNAGQGYGTGYHYDGEEEDEAEDAGVFGTIPPRNAHSAELYHHNMLQAPPPQRLQALSAGHNSKKKSIESKAAKVQGAKNLPKGGVLPSLSPPAASTKPYGSQSTPALVPRTRSEKLKSIDSSWGAEMRSNIDDSQERPPTSGPNSPTARRSNEYDSSSSGAFGSPLVDKNRSAGALSAVSRVNNALIGGMNRSHSFNGNSSFRLGTSESIPEHGEGLDDNEDYESPQKSPVKSMHSAGARGNASAGRPPVGRGAVVSRKDESSDDGGEDDDDDDDEEIGWSPFTITA